MKIANVCVASIFSAIFFFFGSQSKKSTNSVLATKAPRTECLRFQNGWTIFFSLASPVSESDTLSNTNESDDREE